MSWNAIGLETTVSENEFEEYLNDSFTVEEIMGDGYGAGSVFRAVDGIAFRESFLNYLDAVGAEETE